MIRFSMKQCIRCHVWKTENLFIEDLEFCRDCMTHEEINEYVTSPLSKVMKGLSFYEKSLIIKELIKEHKNAKRNNRPE